MDILCPKCAEPWDHDSLHVEVEERFARTGAGDEPMCADEYQGRFREVRADFYARGCIALGGSCSRPVSEQSRDRAHIASELYGLFEAEEVGALMEDFGLI